MRISDWSSDVCSSDLPKFSRRILDCLKVENVDDAVEEHENDEQPTQDVSELASRGRRCRRRGVTGNSFVVDGLGGHRNLLGRWRAAGCRFACSSEERRGGREWVGTCKSRGWPA